MRGYAAELKRLCEKAYPNRDPSTRAEDLLRRFMDGLVDEKAQFHIEYIKESSNIDQAVYEAVNFQETRRKPSKADSQERRSQRPTRMVRPQEMDEEDRIIIWGEHRWGTAHGKTGKDASKKEIGCHSKARGNNQIICFNET